MTSTENHRHSCPFFALRDSVFFWDSTGFSVARVKITGYNLEDAEIRKHPGYGGMFLNNVAGDGMHMARAVAWEHHECPDSKNRLVRMKKRTDTHG